MKIPDVTGYTIEKAEQIMKKAGIQEYSVTVTSPPGKVVGYEKKDLRVIRVSTDGKTAKLLAGKTAELRIDPS
ncbi:MAG: PASTA domain-containing protein [Eubacteriales bacterium]|nr:PASTA domain-containing protein [Eubacteriales bacterium]